MSEVNNEIRRTRIKFELLQQEGIMWLLRDLCEKIDIELQQEVPDEVLDYLVHLLKTEYKITINAKSQKEEQLDLFEGKDR